VTSSSAPLATPATHRPGEDVFALLIATSFIALGLTLLKSAGLVTGGIAGVALTASYLTGAPVGVLFFVLNLPFYVFAQRALGWPFTLKTLATNALLSGLTLLTPKLLRITSVDPLFAALFGGLIIGMGVLALSRHRSSVGGIGVMMVYLSERRGISAGRVQLLTDLAIILCGMFAIDGAHLLLSLLSAGALSLVLIVNHKPGRYTGAG
jgi:uncharacterized membrane-anchored protein YitT (DUF2179 family)